MNKNTTLRNLFASTCLLGALALLAPAAEAHGKKGFHRGHGNPHHRKVEVHRHDVHRHEVFVPRTIGYGYRETFAPYYAGRVWVPQHRHFHANYRFPVAVNGAVVYRPYSYCDDRLVVVREAPLPRLAFGLDFDGDTHFQLFFSR